MPDGASPVTIRQFTSSEAGAWSNSYLISQGTDAVLYDVFMLHGDATGLADEVERLGKALTTVMISHAHPDHFMGLDVIADRFPESRIVSTANVVADIAQDGPWMFDMLRKRLGSDGPTRLVVPEPLETRSLRVGDTDLEVVEFAEGETKHLACLYLASEKALFSADMIYNEAHLYLAEQRIDAWLTRLEELEAFAHGRVSQIYPGHGSSGQVEALVGKTRAYLRDFAEAIKEGDAAAAEQQMLTKYPNNHAKQFLTVFSLPAYFPNEHSA